MTYQKREGAKWRYTYSPDGAAWTLLKACKLSAAFVGMYTGGGVPKEYVGKFDELLADPNKALDVIMRAIAKARK